MHAVYRSAALALLVLAACSSKGATSTGTMTNPSSSSVALASASAASSADAGDTTPETRARELVALLDKGDFAGAVARFDEAMANGLPEPKLKETWSGLVGQVGPFKGCTEAKTGTSGAYHTVILTCGFGDTSLDLKTAWDDKGRVAGFFASPKQPPYALPPYAAKDAVRRDVTVGAAPWALPGELVLPSGKGPFPALILVHGSGPGDRNESVGPNHPFEDIALGLAGKGIAVLRYDKRTKVHAKEVVAEVDHFTVKEESIDDAVSAVKLLDTTAEIDPKRIFVLGHSLGGQLVPRIVQAEPSIAGMVIAAGSTRRLGDVIIEQMNYMASLHGGPTPEEKAKLDELTKVNDRIKEIEHGAAGKPGEVLIGAGPAYYLDLKDYDAPALAAKLNKPTLVLQGGRDYQVTRIDFINWKKALATSPHAKMMEYAKLNHLFLTGDGPSGPDEYEIAGHVDEAVIHDIAAFVSSPP